MPTFQPYDPTANLGTLMQLMMAPARARADALRRTGEIQAQAAQNSGQVWSNLAGSLGQIASKGLNDYAQYKAEAPRREMEQIQLRSARAQEVGAQRAAQVDEAFRSLFGRTDDKGQPVLPTPQELMAIDPERGAKIVQGLDALQDVQGKRFDSSMKRMQAVIRGADALPEDVRAQSYPTLRQWATEQGGVDPKQMPEQYNPQWWAMVRSYGQEPQKPLEHDPTKELRSPDGRTVISAAQPAQMTPAQQAQNEIAKANLDIAKQRLGLAQRAERRQAATAAQTQNAAAAEAVTPDPASANILSQTGLSINAFRYLTGQASQLPRDKATREKAALEAQAWARKNNVDISTIASQYKAYNSSVEKNIERLNNTKIMEQELAGTVQNLQEVLGNSFSNVRLGNVWKIWAGEQINDPTAQQYAFHLGQLRNELAAYYAAAAGRPGSGITITDLQEAERSIKNGISQGGLAGIAKAVENSTSKMGPVMQASVDRSQQAIWNLFGVGQNYKAKGNQGGGDRAPAGPGLSYQDYLNSRKK